MRPPPHHRHNLGPPLPSPLHWGHSGEAEVSITAGGSKGGSLNHCPLSASRAFQPHPRLSADQTTPPPLPNMNPTVYSPPPLDFLLRLPLPVCFCPSNLSCVLRQWSVALTGRRYHSGGRKKWAFIFSTALVAPPPPKKLKFNIHMVGVEAIFAFNEF